MYLFIHFSFIERYFYVICFATFSLQYGPLGYPITFNDWMKENAHLEDMIKKGKDKVEWGRTLDTSKLEELRTLLASPDYKENIPTLIRTIYDYVYLTYSDLPKGPVKNNSMKKLAATTIMDILPEELSNKVLKKFEEQKNTAPDFISIIGMVAYF